MGEDESEAEHMDRGEGEGEAHAKEREGEPRATSCISFSSLAFFSSRVFSFSLH
jgi:hypothetical protein